MQPKKQFFLEMLLEYQTNKQKTFALIFNFYVKKKKVTKMLKIVGR